MCDGLIRLVRLAAKSVPLAGSVALAKPIALTKSVSSALPEPSARIQSSWPLRAVAGNGPCGRSDVAGNSEGRLAGAVEQTTSVHGWVIDKLPLIVMLFLIKYADGFIFADAGDSDNRPATKGLIVR